MRWVPAGCLLGAAIVFSCGGDEPPNGEGCPAGTEDCACYGNSTCDEGLSCEAERCRVSGGGDAGRPNASEGGAPSAVAGASGKGPTVGEGGLGGVTSAPEAGGDAGGMESEGGSPPSEGGASGAGGAGGAGGEPDDTLITVKRACGSRDVTGATVVGGVITESTKWSGVVHVTGDVSVKNEATLTIAPGTKIIVGANANIELGAQNSAPRLVALGTADAPISLCGENDLIGTWGGLKLRATVKADSVLQNVLIDGGGVGAEGALRVESKALLRGVQLQHTVNRVLVVSDFAPGSDRVTIYTPLFQPVRFLSLRGATNFPDNSEVNAEPSALTTLTIGIEDSSFNESARLRDFGLPYLQTGDVVSQPSSSSKITFDAGVLYRLPLGRTLRLYDQEVEMLGTPERPVRIQHLCDGAACSSGGGVAQLGRARLENVVFAGLGTLSVRGLSIAGGPTSLKNVRVEKSGSNVALELGGEIVAGSSGLEVEGDYLVLSEWDTLRTLPLDTKVVGARVQADYRDVAVSGTLKAFSFDIYLDNTWITSGATLTVDPGARLRFDSSTALRVLSGGALRAVGTAASPILFSQPTNSGDRWNGISVDAGASATLERVIVEYGGASGTNGANISAAAAISLKNSILRNSMRYGLSRRATDATDYTLTNTFENNTSGPLGIF